MTNAVELDHVTAGYDRARPVVRDVCLRVERGDFVGMVGPSGSGKTTILRSMLGMAPSVAGRVTVNGKSIGPGGSPSGTGYVPQTETIDWTFPVTVEQVVMMGRIGRMGVLPWASRSDRAAVEALLERLGIAGLGKRQIRELSGGQQQRTFLARALVADLYGRLVAVSDPWLDAALPGGITGLPAPDPGFSARFGGLQSSR